MSALIEVRGLAKRFRRAAGAAVEDVSFAIEEGRTFGLVGESGSGKTTVGRLMLRLIEPTAGEVLFEGRNLFRFSRRALGEYRRHAQIVFQDPFSSLNPRRTIADSLSDGYRAYDLGTKAERRAWLEEWTARVGLDAGCLERHPHQFSGGQLQRLVIARALTLHPRFLVADEPVSALDVSIQAQILNLLRRLQRELNFTMLMISHDLRVIRHMCDRVGVMHAGRLVETGTCAEIYANPHHPYTRELLRAAPVIDEALCSPHKEI